ncbi:hypothetical protein [Rufibacter tibetensis]|uniref:Uncharacterized protein n=1 Tax=Rufibacter tibetensis TaxID=512763 RepID=A0A0P0C985_9BACT|nr:hypothetical protein [Rufibacter tibetensis]ALJ01679.1 hypothetical protein DC20_21740 [Rufibacter tibetensis]
MKKEYIKQILPLILLFGGLIYALIAYLTANVGLTWRHYLGILFVLATGALYLLQPKYFKKALGATLLLGTFNVLAFTPTITTVNLSIASLGVTFQPFSFIGLLTFMAFNRKRIVEILGIQSPGEPPAGYYYLDEEKFEKLKESYRWKSYEELNTIISSGKFTIEAVEAAKKVLEEKTHPNIA